MGIFGAAKKGFGMLKKGKKGVDHKKRLQVFKKASQKADRDQTIKKAKRLIKEGEAAIKKRLMSPHPMSPIPKGKKWIGRINPDGTHVKPQPKAKTMDDMMDNLTEDYIKHRKRPKKRVGGIMRALKKANKLKGVPGGKGMVALGAGSAGTGLVARHHIKKYGEKVKKAKKKKEK